MLGETIKSPIYSIVCPTIEHARMLYDLHTLWMRMEIISWSRVDPTPDPEAFASKMEDAISCGYESALAIDFALTQRHLNMFSEGQYTDEIVEIFVGKSGFEHLKMVVNHNWPVGVMMDTGSSWDVLTLSPNFENTLEELRIVLDEAKARTGLEPEEEDVLVEELKETLKALGEATQEGGEKKEDPLFQIAKPKGDYLN